MQKWLADLESYFEVRVGSVANSGINNLCCRRDERYGICLEQHIRGDNGDTDVLLKTDPVPFEICLEQHIRGDNGDTAR